MKLVSWNVNGLRACMIIGDERVHGRLIFVDDEGRLHVEIDGKECCLTSVEVSFGL